MTPIDERLARRRAEAERRGLDRRLPQIIGGPGVRYTIDGHPVVGFCSNDYLGMASHGAPIADAARGASASRLVCGDHPEQRRVETAIARALGTPDAVLFPSGYQLNVGVLPALVESGDEVFSDRLAHASLIDGLRLAPTRPQILEHNVPPPPPDRLDPPGENTPARWWVCESTYSMDGDGPATADLQAHLDDGGFLYLDEAHAFGLYPGGRGRAANASIRPTATVVTLGKAVGRSGAALGASKIVCDHVRTTARSFVYSTGVAPATCASIGQALALVGGAEGDARRERLWRNVDLLRTALSLPPRVPDHPAPIIPLVLGGPRAATEASRALIERGLHVQAIRPPTVPAGTSRLRITLCADHRPDDIHRLAEALTTVLLRGDTVQSSPAPRP